jgi:hypothetical protein
MKSLIDKQDFAIVIGINWNTWLVGISFHRTEIYTKSAVFRLGPMVCHLVVRVRA